MKSILKNTFLFILFALILFSFTDIKKKSQITNLKCEYLINPIGIDSQIPRFTWQLLNEEIGSKQRAFEIIIGTDSLEISKGRGNMWESGRIDSGQPLISYGGVSLSAFTKYFWSIRIWDQNYSLSSLSEIALLLLSSLVISTFCMGNSESLSRRMQFWAYEKCPKRRKRIKEENFILTKDFD